MPRFAANVSWLWADLDEYERLSAAARAGFRRVEMHFPQKLDATRIERVLAETGLELVLFNQMVRPDERGLLSDPDGKGRFRASLQEAIDLARRLRTVRIHVESGFVPDLSDTAQAEQVIVANLRRAARLARESGVQLLVEPVNRTDRPGVYPDTVERAAALVSEVADATVALQLDTYHAAMNGEDPLSAWRGHMPLIGHVQIADYPGRHEPGTGTLPLTTFLSEMDRLGYGGTVGLEYRPMGDTDAGLAWLPKERRS